ncbi:MAG: fibronectin type III domain-containing protein [Armatimonadetes bacterium]|nr:fibronectin type III domain-containing protein [Armatimonadota bacterium]
MSYYDIPTSALPAWTTNFVSTAALNSVTLGLSAPQVAALQSQLAALNSAFAARETALEAAKSATVAKDQKVAEVIGVIRGYANTWQASATVPDTLIAALGLNVRDTTHTTRPVFVPLALVVLPNVTGTNELRWKRNGNLQGVKFDIEVSYEAPGAWAAVTTVTSAKFKHTGQTPGQTAYYRVRARNGANVSDWSVSASTFANDGGGTLTLAA